MKKRHTIISIVGARPQFVKLAPLAAQLSKKYNHFILHSGQHYDFNLSESFFKQLKIPSPDKNLNVGSGDHGRQTGRILERAESVLKTHAPDMVLVYGDTNTTLAGALSAAKLGIPIGHIEAGLRSFRKSMPEEINRKMTDHISDLLFYPTVAARRNLHNEGLRKGLVHSGDLMYELLENYSPAISGQVDIGKKYGLEQNQYIFITLHRAENVDNQQRLERFVDILKSISEPKLFLAHPHTIRNLKRFKLLNDLKKVDNLVLEEPQPYFESLALMAGSRLVMTDSGGIQKEAYFWGRPCLTLRSESEWIETVTSGRNILVDLSYARIRKAMSRRLRSRGQIQYRVRGKRPSEVIAQKIKKFLD